MQRAVLQLPSKRLMQGLTLGKRLRSKALNSSYSKALLISTILSDLKLKSATASPSYATLVS